MSALVEGTIFSNRYRILRCIGQGGMGAVYEVEHVETERRCALKVMHPHVLQNKDMRNRFRQEAKVAAHVESEHVVGILDAGIDDATAMPFLVMELLRGEEIGKRLASTGRFAPQDVVLYLYQTALALDKSHKAHIVHRDLKPENLFLTVRDDGRPHIKVLDFGIAKFIVEGDKAANATRSIGTPLYMAPEQFRPGGTVSPRTDLYALGMIAYTLLVGQPYWADESRDDTTVFAFASIVMHGPKEAASVRALRCGVTLPPSFDAWFTNATAVDPAGRFSSATAEIAALADALGVPLPAFDTGSSGPHDTVALPNPPPPQLSTTAGLGSTAASQPIGRSHRTVVLVLGGIAALVIAIWLLGLVITVPREDPRPVSVAPPAAATNSVLPVDKSAPHVVTEPNPAPPSSTATTVASAAPSASASAAPSASVAVPVVPRTPYRRPPPAPPPQPTSIYVRD